MPEDIIYGRKIFLFAPGWTDRGQFAKKSTDERDPTVFRLYLIHSFNRKLS